jgi:hypothetical protein
VLANSALFAKSVDIVGSADPDSDIKNNKGNFIFSKSSCWIFFLDKTAKVERYFFYLQRVIVLRLPFSVKDVLRNLSGTSHLQAGRPKVGAIIFFSYLGRSLCSGCFVKERCTHRERAKCCEYRVDAHYYLQTKPPMNLFLFFFFFS